jgi:hypothetical protein
MNLNFSQLIVLILLLSVGLVSGTLLNNGFNGPSVRLAVDVRHPVGLAQDVAGDQCLDTLITSPTEATVCFDSGIPHWQYNPLCADDGGNADQKEVNKAAAPVGGLSVTPSGTKEDCKKMLAELKEGGAQPKNTGAAAVKVKSEIDKLKEKEAKDGLTEEEKEKLKELEDELKTLDIMITASKTACDVSASFMPSSDPPACTPSEKCESKGIYPSPKIRSYYADGDSKIICFTCEAGYGRTCEPKKKPSQATEEPPPPSDPGEPEGPTTPRDDSDEENDNPRDGEQPPLPIPDGKRGDLPSDG